MLKRKQQKISKVRYKRLQREANVIIENLPEPCTLFTVNVNWLYLIAHYKLQRFIHRFNWCVFFGRWKPSSNIRLTWTFYYKIKLFHQVRVQTFCKKRFHVTCHEGFPIQFQFSDNCIEIHTHTLLLLLLLLLLQPLLLLIVRIL